MKIEPADVHAIKPLLADIIREAVADALVKPNGREQDGDGRLAYSEAEAAALIGVKPNVLREQRRLGRISYCRGPGRRILYRREHIDLYLGEREVNASAQRSRRQQGGW